MKLHQVEDHKTCSDKPEGGVDASLGKWGWGYTALFIFGLIAAAVLLERIWTCGRKTILQMQGREGFRTVFINERSRACHTMEHETCRFQERITTKMTIKCDKWGNIFPPMYMRVHRVLLVREFGDVEIEELDNMGGNNSRD